jgi:hypothetical protein
MELKKRYLFANLIFLGTALLLAVNPKGNILGAVVGISEIPYSLSNFLLVFFLVLFAATIAIEKLEKKVNWNNERDALMKMIGFIKN